MEIETHRNAVHAHDGRATVIENTNDGVQCIKWLSSHSQMENSPLKLEGSDERDLSNVLDRFDEVLQKRQIKVRPWIGDDLAEKPILHYASQLALFKCMQTRCLFATDDENEWKLHMFQHMKLIDVLNKKISSNSGSLAKRLLQKFNKFLECPYCPTTLRSHVQITNHIEEEHRRSILQCMFCNYRTIEMDNIALHYGQYHAEEKQEVLISDGRRELKDQDEEMLSYGHYQYVKKIKCGKIHFVFD